MMTTSLGFVLLAIAGFQTPAADQERVPVRWAEPRTEVVEPDEPPQPLFATIAGIGGRVKLDCLVSLVGRATDCVVVEAAPPGLGFERIAVERSPRLRFIPASRGGVPEEARATFAVGFPVDGWPDRVDTEAWPQPSETAIAAMRPIAEVLTRRNEAVKSDWQVDADREAVVTKLVEEIDQSQREERVRTLTIALARSLTEDEAQLLLDAPDYDSARDLWDRVFAAGPESQNETGASRQMMRDRYCAIYECEIADTAR